MEIKNRIRSARTYCCSSRSRGFTLVELMVSLLIGLVIVLGATQIFMVSRESFRGMEALGVKQSALNYSIDVLSRDIRRAEWPIDWDSDDKELSLNFSGLMEPGLCDSEEVISKTYFLKETAKDDSYSDWTLYVDVECDEGNPADQPLLSGFLEGGLDVTPISLSSGSVLPDDEPSGLWSFTLDLVPVNEGDNNKILFQVMNRMRALSPESDEVLPADCYTPSGNIKGKCK